MFRRHFFLVIAIVLILAMGVAAGFKLLGGPKGAAGGPGGGAPQQAQGGGRATNAPGGGAAGGRGGGRGATLVGAVPVTQRAFTDRIEVLGVAKGQQSVTLTSNQAEMVTAVRFKPGQRVTKGQVLLDLKADEEDAQIMQTQAVVNQAKKDADRWATLADRGVASRASAEQYGAAYQTAQANLKAAQARRSDRVIRAPFSGTVGLSDIAPGALISPGTAIATLDDASVIHVDFDVPDRFLPVIHEGMAIVAKSDAYPDIAQAGKVSRIDTRIDERTRAVKARAEFKNPGGRVKPGMLIRVGIERGARQSPAVPESAIQFSGDNAFVFVLTPRVTGQNGQPAGAPGAGGQASAGPGAAAQGRPGLGTNAPAGAPGAGPMAGGPGRPGGPQGTGGMPGGGPRVQAPPCAAMVAAAGAVGGRQGPGGPGQSGRAGNAPALNAPAPGANAPAGGAAAAAGGGRRGGGGGRPGQAEQRKVLAGLIEGGYVEVKEGLKAGEIVVSDGLNKVQPGQPVSYCAAQLPQVATAGGGRPGMGGPGGPGGGRGGDRSGAPGALAPSGMGRPGGQSGGGGRQGRPGGPGGRIAGASS